MTHPSEAPAPGPGDDRPAELLVMQMPPGARLLSADEAVELLLTGNHRGSDQGNAGLDAALVDLIREQRILAMLDADGRIAFTPIPGAS